MKNRFSKVASFIDESIQDKTLPGVVLAVASDKKLIYEHVAGVAHDDLQINMTKKTMFDLASLTKVIATLPSILKLMEEGKLDLDDPVYYYIPLFQENNSDITVRHLLTHTSGYQPEIKFYLNNYTLDEAVTIISKITNKQQAGSQVIYSDLNYIVLGYMVQQITKRSLDQYAEKHIFKPLNMKDTGFNPPKSKKNRMAATEYIDALNIYRWGEVHDENANHFQGVSGHAGLFSTVGDLTEYSRMILNGGWHDNQKILSEQTIRLSYQSFTKELNLNRGLGWQLYDVPSMSGQYLQKGFGHTGFTGTSIWFDPHRKFAIILLTNRVHFGRNTDIARFRRIVHNLVALAMEK